MSLLLVDVAILGGGFVLGRWLVRSMRRRSAPPGPPDAADAQLGEGKPVPPPPVEPFAGLCCKLGDVLVRAAEGDEAWLAGALVFSEERPVAALFIAPEAGGDRGVWVRHAAGAELTWLAPVPISDVAGLAKGTEPPHALEHGGLRYERARRLPVKVTRLGTGAPAVGSQAVIAEYTAAGAERLLVIAGDGMLAWKGLALREHEVEVLPGDASTLER